MQFGDQSSRYCKYAITMTDSMLSPLLHEMLVCPRDKLTLEHEPGVMFCAAGHRYRVVQGVPILLLQEIEQTHGEGVRALAVAARGAEAALPEVELREAEVDPFVKDWIAATNGNLYKHLVGTLTDYPIPGLRLPPPGEGKVFLEIGCNWGRWCIAAARLDTVQSELILRSRAFVLLGE